MLIKTNKKFIRRDCMIMMGAILLLFFFSLNHYLSRIEGFILISTYTIYLYYISKTEISEIKKKHYSEKKPINTTKNIFLLILGLLILLFTSSIVIENGIKLADEWKVSDSLIGIALIGIGTALPELATSLVALRRKSSGMSLGLLVGSNITNPLLALAIGILISGYTVSNTILWIDIPVWFAATFLVLLLVYEDFNLKKKDAIILFFVYMLYLAFRVLILK